MPMNKPSRLAYFHVLNLEESRMWHQTDHRLREMFQHDLILRVDAQALRRRAQMARIYDSEENLLWYSHELADEGALEP